MKRICSLLTVFFCFSLSEASITSSYLLGSSQKLDSLFDNRPVYEASATIIVTGRFFENNFLDLVETTEPSDKDFAYFVVAARSDAVLRAVKKAMSDDLLSQVRESMPKDKGISGPLLVEDFLRLCIDVQPQPDQLTIKFVCRHSDPILCAEIANLFALETIHYQLVTVLDRVMVRVESLRKCADRYRQKVEEALNDDITDELIAMELDIDKKMCSMLMEEMKIASAQITMCEASAMIVDRAFPPILPTARFGSKAPLKSSK